MTKKGLNFLGEQKCTPRQNPGYAYVKAFESYRITNRRRDRETHVQMPPKTLPRRFVRSSLGLDSRTVTRSIRDHRACHSL